MTCDVSPVAMFIHWLYYNTFAISLYFQASWWADADVEAEIDGVFRVGEIWLICTFENINNPKKMYFSSIKKKTITVINASTYNANAKFACCITVLNF